MSITNSATQAIMTLNRWLDRSLTEEADLNASIAIILHGRRLCMQLKGFGESSNAEKAAVLPCTHHSLTKPESNRSRLRGIAPT